MPKLTQAQSLNYEHEKKVLIEYLKMKTEIQDWHAVADAAMDLRELEVLLKKE